MYPPLQTRAASLHSRFGTMPAYLLGFRSHFLTARLSGKISRSKKTTLDIRQTRCFARQASSQSPLKWSFVRGRSEKPLQERSIYEYFSKITAQHGRQTAVISHSQNQKLSFSQLDRIALHLARCLYHHPRLTIKPGERVCVQLGNTVEHVALTLALFRLGAIVVPLNPAANKDEVASAIRHVDASCLVTGRVARQPYGRQKGCEPIIAELRHKMPAVRFILVDNRDERQAAWDRPAGSNSVDAGGDEHALAGIYRLESFFTSPLPDIDQAPLPAFPHSRATATIQFTSGTTSAPKAACLTHLGILNNGIAIGDRLNLLASDSMCCPPALFHCFGVVLGLMATLTHGCTIVFPSEAFDPASCLDAVVKHECTGLHGVPTMFAAELELLRRQEEQSSNNDGSSSPRSRLLRTGIAAGSTVPKSLMKELNDTLGLDQLCVCYGMTETSPVSVMSRPTDPVDQRLDSVGTVMPHLSVKIVDPSDKGRVLAIGRRGELAVAGYSVMAGYWNDAGRTAEVVIEQAAVDPNISNDTANPTGQTDPSTRWMFSGDEAYIDPDGFVHITGRIKDLIIRGGENISPVAIESCLFSHSRVVDVAVVGKASVKYGEEVVGFVVLRDPDWDHQQQAGSTGPRPTCPATTAQLKEWVRDRLSSHLVPAEIWQIDQLPKTGTGKVQKYLLRAIAEAGAEPTL